jgi:hypothetical protein
MLVAAPTSPNWSMQNGSRSKRTTSQLLGDSDRGRFTNDNKS